jgi:isopentenyl-diphosphate delta-isomerase
MEQVILVDEADNAVGTMEKLEAHQKGVLHRAFSILLSNSKGEWLLQKRSWKKYHSAGLWTNTCCSHPRPGETMEEATGRKLEQEMGIRAPLRFAYKFLYKTPLNDLTEHELDHVYIGVTDLEPQINADEVEDWRFASPEDVEKEIHENPDEFTHWFKLIAADNRLRKK